MSVSATHSPSWQQRTRNGPNKPRPMDLRVSDASKVQARPVSLGRAITQSLEYMRDHPVDFIISIGTFIAVKALVTMAFPVLAGIGAAVLAAGILGVGRSLNQEFRARNRRVDQLYKYENNPSPADLAKAEHIDIGGVIETGFKRAALTGIIGSAAGMLISSLFENFSFARGSASYASNAHYTEFLEDLADDESRNSGLYQAENDLKFVGKYQFGEPAMVETGYYSWTDEAGNLVDKTNWRYTDGMEATKVNDWSGTWTEKAQTLGINSTEDFKNSPEVQELAVRELMAENWKYIIHYNLDDYIGQEFQDSNGDSFKVTPAGLLRGAHLGGVGNVQDFLESNGADDASDGRTRVSDYMREGETFKVPFEAGNPNQISFATMYAVTDSVNYNGIDFIHPLPTDSTYLDYKSEFGRRVAPMPGASTNHLGIDIAANTGTPVLSTASGEVVSAGREGGAGKIVKIFHGLDENGHKIYTRSAHLSAIDVRVGDKLPQGYKIGEVGSTGISTASHLHYELNVNGKLINPRVCLPEVMERGVRDR